MTTPGKKGRSAPDSQALQINLQRTAVDVVIPEKQRLLLEATSDFFGIQKETEKLLREINHPFVGWTQTLNDLHRRALSDFYCYNAHPSGAEAIGIYHSLYEKIVDQANPLSLRKVAVGRWLSYLERIVKPSGEHLHRNLTPVGEALSRISEIFRVHPDYASAAGFQLKRVTESVLEAAAAGPVDSCLELSVGLLRDSLDQCYADWLGREDPVNWLRDSRVGDPTRGESVPERVVAISHQHFKKCRTDLVVDAQDSVRNCARALLSLPDQQQIARAYLAAASAAESTDNEAWKNLFERTRWMSKVLATEALSEVHEMALRDIVQCSSELLARSDRDHRESFVRETFSILRQGSLTFPHTVFSLITTIGAEALATRDQEWIDRVFEEILRCDFHYPEFGGFTHEWGVRVNPDHLKNIRAYLALIETDPYAARRLLAALVVHLKIGGVFVADTDLFQKDISKLLAADIGPVFNQIKTLVREFPVYFNDIGAEGDLREASTRIDEIQNRQDPLCHFLRKQCHVESNPQLVPFVEEIARFWATGEAGPLQRYVPERVYEALGVRKEEQRNLQHICAELIGHEASIDTVFDLEKEELQRRLKQIGSSDPLDLGKIRLLFRLRDLLRQKYDLNHSHLLQRLRSFHWREPGRVDQLERALLKDRHEKAFEILLDLLVELKSIVLSRGETQAVEDTYHKRHIAVGIPSMYGRYREPRFEAMGLIFRVESFGKVLLERMIEEQNLSYITNLKLETVCRWLHLLLRALRLDGFNAKGLGMGLSMLEQGLKTKGFTVDQYINVFQALSHSINYLIRVRFLDVYEKDLQYIIGRLLDRGLLDRNANTSGKEAVLMVSESFLRDLISQSFGLQVVDNVIGKILRTLMESRQQLSRSALNLLMTCDLERCFSRIPGEILRSGTLLFGYKGFIIKQLAREGFPVPTGFIITTEAFRCRTALMVHSVLYEEYVQRVRQHVKRLEEATSCEFGNPENPLLLSVRSGAAISMPGMMDSFLNVGMTAEIAEGLAGRIGSPWAAWDSYRRFLQFWGMSLGIDRDEFDREIQGAKQKYSVPKKAQLPPARMKELAFRYAGLLADNGVKVVEEPFEQLLRCIEMVMNSWNSDKAKVYRREMQIAEDWGTAVIVQNMVFGNLRPNSGTGVVFTHYPRQIAEAVQLYGDFIMQGQGEDVVSGLVETHPITEQQRLLSGKNGGKVSLEKRFPAIYEALLRIARTLIFDQGMQHQEIEFTFESDDPQDLYILQTRDIAFFQESSTPTFVPTKQLEKAKAATGIGVGGGALTGRVAHTGEDVLSLRERFPDDLIILLRSDTVPEDIPLILKADGLLTAVGGATSHAAVAAQGLGRTCVVGCQSLLVRQKLKESLLGGKTIRTGDFLSINGMDGSIYFGRHRVTMTRTQGLTR